MTSTSFVLRLAWREARAARRRLLLLTASVMAGVGALVAVNSFTDNMKAAVAEQAQALLGADLSVIGRKPAADVPSAKALLDSLRAIDPTSFHQALSASLPAMAFGTDKGARLVQLRSVDPGWPYYGTIETSPTGIWPRLQDGGVIVDPSLLTMINVKIGDTLGIGTARLPIIGTVVSMPGDVGLQMAFGARVLMATRLLPTTGLLAFGSRVSYETFVQLPDGVDAQHVAARLRPIVRDEHLRVRTVADDRDRLSDNLARLGDYLGLVALAALLLGGLGVASAVHVFIQRKLDTIAVLRCLGATSRQVFAVYLLQAIGMGVLGSVLGALAGIGLQRLMPFVLAGFLPVNVRIHSSLPAILIGIGLGIWTAIVFALLPLLGIREIPPLATLRRDVNPITAHWHPLRVGAGLLLALSVVGLATVQVGSLRQGAIFAGGITLALMALRLASWLLVRASRRWTPATWPYLVRQGLANLHRPANQTVTVVMALGFGAFILTTIFTAQYNLLRDMRVDDVASTRANLVLFDIQTDQRHLVDSTLDAQHIVAQPFVPIVPMRLLNVKGRPIAELLAQHDTLTDSLSQVTTPSARGGGGGAGSLWAYRREYRSTYRAQTTSGEQITIGRWFDSTALRDGRSAATAAEISIETGLAAELSVGVGDRITWDLQGVPVYTRITSLREVNWARFEPNFFVVFAPGALEKAPQTWVTLARIPDAVQRGRLQRDLAERASNITTVDLGDVARALEAVADRIIAAIRFMAIFSLATGTVVLVGAISTSRWQRIREGTLLRTLGATRAQVLGILSVEYAALGLSAALVASVLAALAGWVLATERFHVAFVLPWWPMILLTTSLVLLTTFVGLANSFDVLKRPPLEVLRAE